MSDQIDIVSILKEAVGDKPLYIALYYRDAAGLRARRAFSPMKPCALAARQEPL